MFMFQQKFKNINLNSHLQKIYQSMIYQMQWLSILSVNSLILLNVSFPLLILPK